MAKARVLDDVIFMTQRSATVDCGFAEQPLSSTRESEHPGATLKFGIELPTATSGMMHPVPFQTVTDIVDLGVEAEQLGYYDAGGNDHVSTMRFVRQAWQTPPDYYEPLIVLSHIAARTSVLRLTTGVMVLPMREPILLAKQVATLDQLSGGRVLLGVAVGGYRDEFETVRPDMKSANRARLTEETIAALRELFTQRHASFHGEYIHFEDVESYPKPVQNPLPIYSGGNADGCLHRAAELCEGWMPAKIGPDAIREGRETLAQYARAAGRDPKAITTALQSIVCLGETAEQARDTFMNSSFDLFRRSLAKTMTKGVDIDSYLEMNLVGTPDDVCKKVAAYEEAGLEHLSALLFVGNTVDEIRRQIRFFAKHVVPAFPEPSVDRPGVEGSNGEAKGVRSLSSR
jgi:probable F420-dependent oxidoreductase